MQTIQEPDVLQQPFCENGDKNTIPSTATGSQLASLAEGFPLITQQPVTQGGIPPERRDFNGAFNLLSKYNYAIQNGWLPTFKQEVSTAIGGYAEGACLWYIPSTGTYAGQVLMLKSLVANNTYDFTANPDGYIGTYWQIVTSAGGGGGLPLLTPIWSDHLLNDASYLRADTNSWQSGAVYVSAYNHFVDDIDGVTAETETIAGTTITFYRSDDSHKIVLANQASNVEAIYNATGIGYYFILDTTNQRFKLPRNMYGFTGLRTNAGDYVPESLPNITGSFGATQVGYATGTTTGAFSAVTTGTQGLDGGGLGTNHRTFSFNATSSNSVYQNNAPVQQRATQAYLYFYVGNTVQNETSVDVGEITEEINEINSRPYVVETYKNGASWYRVYSDGWCEQGGIFDIGSSAQTGSITVSLLKTFINTNYIALVTPSRGTIINSSTSIMFGTHSLTVSSFAITWLGLNSADNVQFLPWKACGYIN